MLSVALLLGFYLLGVLVLAASVGAIWLMLAAGYINVGVVLAAPAVAFAVLRGMLTAGHKFKGLPGSVQVTPQTQPELFGEITDIADRMGADAPDEVYLVHDVNAFVLEDTRLLGLVTRKRVMGIGLPLIDSLSVDELRGVIAHEFGHYAGGDTRLAPVVYRGRTSILQTIRSLGGGFVASIYVQYFKVFLRTSMAVSRRQELAADAWAVTVAGTGPTVATNQRLGALGAANDAFLDQYVHSLWIEGRRPVNQFSGFRRMVGHADNADAFRDAAEAVLRRTADAYDSHPSSSERIAFVRELPHVADPGDDRPARALLHDLESLEVELTAAYASVTWLGGALTPVGWDDAGSVYAERLLPISDALM
ncbi:MAG: M48 family metallopeptidase, partial [Actinomycetota bacterium]